MSCNLQGIVAQVLDRSTPTVVRGSDAYLTTQLVYRGSQDPAGTPGFVGATGFFQNEDSTVLAVSGTSLSPDLGTVKFTLSEAETALLSEGDEQNFEIAVEDDRGLVFYQLEAKLAVASRYF